MMPCVSVVLPCLNEAASVGAVVTEARSALEAAGASGEVIVVDNGSTDGSAGVAIAAGARVVRESRRGYGTAYLAGFRAASGDVIVMADADGSYDFSCLPALLERLQGGDDLVIGSRFAGVIAPGAMPWLHRHVGNPILSGLLNRLYRTGVQDAHCGMRAFRRSELERMHLRMPGMEFASEMVVNAARAGMRIGEVPVNYRARTGTSKLRSLQDGWRHLRFLLLYSPTHLFLLPGSALLAIGVLMLLALLPGPLRVAGLFFDIHFMVLGALLALLGFQAVAFGVCAKALAAALDLQSPDQTLRAVRRVWRLERGLFVAIVLFVIGFAVDFDIALRWIASGLGELNEVRPALFALVAMLLGAELGFASLFLSAIDLQATPAARLADTGIWPREEPSVPARRLENPADAKAAGPLRES